MYTLIVLCTCRRVCDLFEDNPVWKAVPAGERRDVFEDVTFTLAKRERVQYLTCHSTVNKVVCLQEQEKQQRERNCHVLAKTFRKMTNITYHTAIKGFAVITFLYYKTLLYFIL